MGRILLLIVINIITAHINGEKVPLWILKAGDTLNKYTLNSTSTDYLGSVFNDYHYGQMLIENQDCSSSCKITYKREMCASLNSLKPLLYPDFYRGDDKLDVSKLDCLNNENQGYFDEFKNYLDESKYLFGLVKICRVMETKTLYADPIKSKNLPIVNGSIVHKVEKLPFGFLRFRRGFETDYVSSISTGNCLFQIFVNKIDVCENIPDRYYINKLTGFFFSPVFKSKITTINQNQYFETDPEFSNSDESLYNLAYSFTDLMKNHNSKENVLELKLLPLPEVPKLSRSVVGQLDVRPGDVLDHHDFSRITSSLMNDSTANSVSLSAPKTVSSYSHCFEYVAPAEPLTKFKEEDSNYDYNLNLFENMVEQNNYGVDARYLTEDYKCYKVTVCSGLHESETSEMPSIKVIDLNKFLDDSHEYNIMYDDHAVMRFSAETKLYYVSRMHFGNCLFQAQMYPSSTSFADIQNHRQLPVYKGQLISANRNGTLEKLVKEVISSYENSDGDSLFNLRGNSIDASLPVHNMLTDKALISLDLIQID